MSRKPEAQGEITADMTVNEVITQYPQTMAVFDRHRIDSCCGGALSLAEVTRRHRIDFIALLAELEQA
jgi:regulator of cell morphogenesis and NO signaling